MSQPWLTPAQARELAAAVEDLALRVDEARTARADDPDEARRQTGFRLDEVARDLRRAAGQLLDTGEDLARLASRPEGSCPIRRASAPSTGRRWWRERGQAWCTQDGCT